MVPVERPKTNEKFASREKIRKWKTGIRFLPFLSPLTSSLPLSLNYQHAISLSIISFDTLQRFGELQIVIFYLVIFILDSRILTSDQPQTKFPPQFYQLCLVVVSLYFGT
jgi:hypothetical protein